MKKSKKLLAMALIPALLPLTAFAEQHIAAYDEDEAPDTSVATESEAKQQSTSLVQKAGELKDKLWESALKAMRDAKIKRKVDLPTMALAKGLNLGSKYEIESSPSLAGNYSGIDVWEVNLAAYPELFGASLPEGVGASISMARNITFIQQFKTRKESLMRVPYDPVNKLPINADIFFKKKKNRFTGKEEVALKSGDFVGYRAPMTFSLGKGFSSIAASHLGLSAGLSYVISGDFDVHVFVMDNNMVRVKIMAIKSKSKNASVGISLMGFDGIGNMIVSRLIDTQVLQFYFSKSESDLFLADYIFNLNKSESRDLYNQTVGSKLHVFNKESIKEQILTANPFQSNGSTSKRLLADLNDLNEVSTADLNKPVEERRVVKLLNAHNESETLTHGLKLNLLRIIKGEDRKSKTDSKITILAQDSDNVRAKFKLDSYSTATSFEFFIWGDKDTKTNSLLTQIDSQNEQPVEFIGLQNSSVNESKALSKSDLDKVMNRFLKILPESISSKLEYPKWNFKGDKVKNSYIQQDITFNTDLFKLPTNVSEEKIRSALLDIVNNYGRLKSKPIGAKDYPSGDEKDPVMEAYQRGNYAEAYGYEVETRWGGEKRINIDQEMLLIPQKLALALNSQYSFSDRYAAFDYLYDKIPLFNEISTLLLLKVVPKNILERVVIVRISMSASGQTPLITDYPTTESFNTTNLFREIMSQNGYINDRSYNLRHYLKEDGSQYTLKEIMIEKGS